MNKNIGQPYSTSLNAGIIRCEMDQIIRRSPDCEIYPIGAQYCTMPSADSTSTDNRYRSFIHEVVEHAPTAMGFRDPITVLRPMINCIGIVIFAEYPPLFHWDAISWGLAKTVINRE